MPDVRKLPEFPTLPEFLKSDVPMHDGPPLFALRAHKWRYSIPPGHSTAPACLTPS